MKLSPLILMAIFLQTIFTDDNFQISFTNEHPTKKDENGLEYNGNS